MPSLTSELFVRLVDGVTRPAAGMARALNGLTRAATSGSNISSFGQGMADAGARATARLDSARGAMLDAVGAAYLLKEALQAPIQAAVNFETALEDMGQKAGIPREELGALGTQIKQVAADTNQATMDIAAAVDNLLGMGASQEVALAAAAPIGQAATAYNAATQDLANASYAAVQNLKVAAADIPMALDAMAAAGKQGAFELRDMAQYFPALGASYQRLGQDGVQAVADLSAALQVVRTGTGDASTAANNLNNVLSKTFAPATVAAFKKQGVDLFAEMEAAAQRGLDPIEAIATITEKTLNGDLSKLGTLFQDAQVQAGITSLITGMEDYRRIRDEAMSAEGTVSEDYLRRIQTAAGAIDRWNAAIQNLNISVGTALIPALTRMVEQLTPIISAVTDWTAKNPELASSLIQAGAALVAFRIGLVALKWAGLFSMASTLTTLGAAFKGLGKAVGAAQGAIALQQALSNGAAYGNMAKLGTAFKAIVGVVPGLNLVGPAIAAIATAIGSIGIVGLAVVAGVAAVGLTIYKNWDLVSSTMSGVGAAIGEMLRGIPGAGGALDLFATMGRNIAADWEVAKTTISGFATQIQGVIGSLFSQNILSEEQKAQAAADAKAWAQSILDVIMAVPGQIVEFFQGLGGRILAAIGTIDIGSLIKIPDIGAMIRGKLGEFGIKGGDTSTNADGGRRTAPGPVRKAKGGDVYRGRNYIVGDGGEPEFFTPGADGFITPFSEVEKSRTSTGRSTAAPRGRSTAAPQAPQLHIHGNVYGVDDLEERFAEFSAKQMRTYDASMAGSFADTEST